MKKKEVVEGRMVRLTRWMVRKYLPGFSIYSTRKTVKRKKAKEVAA